MADVVQVVAVVLVHLVLMMSTNIFLKIRGKWWKNRRNWWRRYVGWLSSCNVYKQYIYSRFNFHLGIFAAQENIFKSLQSPLDNLMRDSLQTRLEKNHMRTIIIFVRCHVIFDAHHTPFSLYGPPQYLFLGWLIYWCSWSLSAIFFSYIVTTRKVLTDKTNWPIKPLAWVLHLETLTFDKGIDELTHISGVMLNAWCQKLIDLITQSPIYFIFVFGLISSFNLYLLLHKH